MATLLSRDPGKERQIQKRESFTGSRGMEYPRKVSPAIARLTVKSASLWDDMVTKTLWTGISSAAVQCTNSIYIITCIHHKQQQENLFMNRLKRLIV